MHQEKVKKRDGSGSLGILWFTIFLDLLGFGIIIPILPVVAKEYAVKANWGIEPDIMVGIVVMAFSLMQLLFSPAAGNISDRIGRRPVLLTTILLTASGSLLFGIAGGLGMLILSRLVSGLGSANIPTAQAYIADITAPEDRASKMGLIGAAFGLGFVFGPAIGAALVYIANIYHWDSLLTIGLFSAGLSIINFFLALWRLPESLKEKNPNSDKGFLKAYAGLIPAFRTPILGELFTINLIFITAFVLMQTNAALMWSEIYQTPENYIYIIFGFIGICTALVQGLLIKRFENILGLRKMLLVGTVLVGIGLTILPFPAPEYFYPITALAIICLAVGNGMLMPSLNAMVSKNADAKTQGKILGLFQGVGAIGRVVAPTIAGVLYHYQFKLPYIAAGALMVICLMLATKLLPKLR
ncbi:MAG: MFS transporter [Bacteroidia bacterium]|nr:MFS transporter [Bacteroidia bacterium]